MMSQLLRNSVQLLMPFLLGKPLENVVKMSFCHICTNYYYNAGEKALSHRI
jgi:hypothetical protein